MQVFRKKEKEFQNECAIIRENEVSTMDEKEIPEEELPQEEGYKPRPAWQVWAARVGLVLFIIVLIYEYLRAFLGWG